MAKRVSKMVVTGVTEDMFNESMAMYATDEAEVRKLEAQLDKEITKARAKYTDKLDGLKNRMTANLDVIENYCLENKEVLFSKRRSMDTAHGVVGFRLGTPMLKTLPKWTWAKVLVELKVVLPDYVRVKEEVDKERLLADRSDELVAPHLPAVGVYVDQNEHFFVDLKSEGNDQAEG
jgi:phage host-nuclease inhibitor protein Gam